MRTKKGRLAGLENIEKPEPVDWREVLMRNPQTNHIYAVEGFCENCGCEFGQPEHRFLHETCEAHQSYIKHLGELEQVEVK